MVCISFDYKEDSYLRLKISVSQQFHITIPVDANIGVSAGSEQSKFGHKLVLFFNCNYDGTVRERTTKLIFIGWNSSTELIGMTYMRGIEDFTYAGSSVIYVPIENYQEIVSYFSNFFRTRVEYDMFSQRIEDPFNEVLKLFTVEELGLPIIRKSLDDVLAIVSKI